MAFVVWTSPKASEERLCAMKKLQGYEDTPVEVFSKKTTEVIEFINTA